MRKYKFEDFIDIAEKYLGKNVKYMVGSEIMGFINTFIGSKDPKHMQLKEIASSFYDISCQKIHKEEIFPVGIHMWENATTLFNCIRVPNSHIIITQFWINFFFFVNFLTRYIVK